MAKIKKNAYTIDDVKEILPHLKDDPMRTILTEHFLEKMAHRSIDDDVIYEILENKMPKDIVALEDSNVDFELTYEWDGMEDLAVILSAHPPYSVILISAYFKEVFDEDG
jgi:hypothetical protein